MRAINLALNQQIRSQALCVRFITLSQRYTAIRRLQVRIGFSKVAMAPKHTANR